jgi:fluoride exporter
MCPPGGDHPGVPLDPNPNVGPSDRSGARRRPRRGRRPQAIIVVSLAFGGALGAMARYAISLGLPTESGRFPWGTFVINVSGSLVLGFLLIMLIEQFPRGRLVRPVIGTGFIGAYTTFSTFTVESVNLVRAGDPETALAYIGASLVVGLLAVFTGMVAARVVLRAEHWPQRKVR